MNELSKILGSVERLRLMRFLLRDTKKEYTLSDIEEKTKIKTEILKKELAMMLSIEMIEKYKTNVYTFKKGASILKEAVVYRANAKFKYLKAINDLILDYTSIDKSLLLNKIKGAGRVKLFLLSGIFTGYEKSRLDILYVGEQHNVKEIERNMAAVSVELGRDLRYVIMDVEEYMYRKKMFDSFINEVLEGKVEILLDKLPKV